MNDREKLTSGVGESFSHRDEVTVPSRRQAAVDLPCIAVGTFAPPPVPGAGRPLSQKKLSHTQ